MPSRSPDGALPSESAWASVPTLRRGARALRAIALASSVVVAGGVVMTAPVAAVAGRGAPSGAASAGAAPAVAPASLPTPLPSPEESRQRADQILEDPAYADPGESPLARIGRWLEEQLGKLFSGVSGGGAGSDALAWVVLAVLVGVVLALLARVRGVRGARRARGEPLFETDVEAARGPEEWLAEAGRHEAAGEWKAALRCRFRALLAELIRRRVLGGQAGRTSGEYRAEIRRRASEVLPAFAAVCDRFDAAWYGDEPTGPDENAEVRRLCQEILATRTAVARQPVPAGAASAVPAPGPGGEPGGPA